MVASGTKPGAIIVSKYHVVMAAVLSVAFAAPAFGHDLLISNHTDQDVVGVSARPGEVEDFKRVPMGADRRFSR